LSTGLDLDRFSNHVAAMAQPGVGHLLVNREAAVQIDRALPHVPDSANTTQTLQQQRSMDSLLDQPADGQWLRTAINRLTGDPASPIPTRHVRVGGKPYIAAIATLPTLRWYSVSLLDPALLIPRRELLEMRALFGVSALGCLVILALMLRAFFLKGRLTRQLDRQSQQFADTQTMLEDALARERGTRTTQTNMVHTVAHEFRGTLATIGNTTQMLQMLAQSPEPVEPGRLQPRLDKMLRSVRHLSQLLSDLLGDNRMATSAAQLHLRTGSLNPFCEALAARLAKEHGRPIQWEPGPLPGELMIDWSLLGVAIGNLVDNAIKYAPAGSPILLHTGLANPGRLFVAVSDSGPGIAPEFQRKVFEKSTRLDAASAVPGTGMGLYLVNWIAELHGGSAAVVSASGQGSTFTIYLPRP
jgi:signal transduction histidine kinase